MMFWRPFLYAVFLNILFLPSYVKAVEFYTMESAVQTALKQNPDLESSRFSVQAAEAYTKATRSSFGPTLKAEYSWTHYNKDRPSRYEPDVTTVTMKIEQPLFTGFNLLNNYQKAQLQEEKEILQQKAKQLTLVASVQEAFLSYLKAKESIHSTQRSLKRARAQLEMARTAWQIGLRPRLDLLQAEVDLKQTEAQLIRHENDRDVWMTRLNTLLDMPADAQTEYIGTLKLPKFHRDLENCLKQAMEYRPELLMARKSVDIAYKDLGIVRSSFWPQLSAVAGWSSTGSHLDAAGSRYTKKDYSYAEAGISIDWTVFSSGKRYYLTKQAERQVSAMESAVRSAINSCAYTVRSCLLSAQDAFRSVQVSEKAVISARESYEDARMRYELQSGSYLDLLTAQTALSDAELAEISSRTSYLLALSQLYEAIGDIHPDLLKE